MSRVHLTGESPLVRELAERVQQIWDAYLALNEEAHSAILADDYRAVHPDGTMHVGKPSAKEIAAAPIEDYWLRDFQAWPLAKKER